jgi:hypothetical protein
MDDLAFIRDTMERAASFTAVPGWGMVAVGVCGAAAAMLADAQSTPARWLGVWVIAAMLALAISVVSIARKARAARLPLLSGPGRKFLLSFLPAILAGAVLTVALARAGQSNELPGIWLLLYGAAVTAGGAFSVRVIPIMGFVFMLIGAVALLASAAWHTPLLAAGFGGVHVLFGLIVARKYGG